MKQHQQSHSNKKGHVTPLPQVVLIIREGKPSPVQAANWEALWRKLLCLDIQNEAPPGGETGWHNCSDINDDKRRSPNAE